MGTAQRGRSVALAAAAGGAVVAGLALLSWRDVLEAYHRHGLRSELGHLARILEEPAHTPEGRAVRAHVRTPGGRGALFAVYASRVLAEFPEVPEFSERFRAGDFEWGAAGVSRFRTTAFRLRRARRVASRIPRRGSGVRAKILARSDLLSDPGEP